MNRLRAALIASALLTPALAWADTDINVVVDMTKEGRAVLHPTPDHPAYYVPVVRGYQEFGEVIAGEKPVSPHEVVRVLAPELARQNYRVVDGQHPKADLIIDISWGYISPPSDPGLFDAKNQSQRYALVMGKTFLNVAMPETVGHQDFMDAAAEARYFVVVTAYDFATWTQKHYPLVMWKAKMSLPKGGVFMGDVLEPLVKAGAPFFGRETVNVPKLVPAVPEGQVKIGTVTVRPDADPSPPPTPAK